MWVAIVMGHGVPLYRWMVYFMENQDLKMDDDWGYPYDLGHLHKKRKKPGIGGSSWMKR